MKLILTLILTVLSFSASAQSNIADRVRQLEARVAALEQGSGGYQESYCLCEALIGYAGQSLVRVSGPERVSLSSHFEFSSVSCDEALARHPACR
jgi:hypothetical protein